jgi:hypothetical protein
MFDLGLIAPAPQGRNPAALNRKLSPLNEIAASAGDLSY